MRAETVGALTSRRPDDAAIGSFPCSSGAGSGSGFCLSRDIHNGFGELVGVPGAFGVASHTGFLSGRLTSSNEGTWVLFHHDSSAAPQTMQTASPVCGTKNFVSVRLYSAPQLHRTIVAILEICARNRPFSSVELCHNQTDPLPRFRFQRKHSLRVLKRKTHRLELLSL